MNNTKRVKPHDFLSCCLATNLEIFGLKHLNSEVPKPKGRGKGREIPDILCFDILSKIPVIIELKTKQDTKAQNGLLVFEQLSNYINDFSEKFSSTLGELYTNRYSNSITFNYIYGIVGIILSPFEAPSLKDFKMNEVGRNTIIWVRYEYNEKDFLFSVIDSPLLLSNGNVWKNHLESIPKISVITPPSMLTRGLPLSTRFIEELHQSYLGISRSIFPYFMNYYIAYRGLDTKSAVFGFEKDSKGLKVGFHVSITDQDIFLQNGYLTILKNQSLSYYKRPGKEKIIWFDVNENLLKSENIAKSLISSFNSLAKQSYELARLDGVEKFKIANPFNLGRILKI